MFFHLVGFQDEYEEAVVDHSDSSERNEQSACGSKSRMSAVSSLFTDVTDEEARRTRMTVKKSRESTKSKPSVDRLATQVSIVLDRSSDERSINKTIARGISITYDCVLVG